MVDIGFSDVESMLIILICGVLGVVNCAILNYMYNNGIVLDELITGTITLNDIFLFTIIVWLLVGVIIAVVKTV